ncbi:RNase H domain-containing protein [Trichonephila clavipes]|nr:RNase H domain-containing protein [Trichonephila clavipes]
MAIIRRDGEREDVTNLYGTFPLIFLGVFLGNINSRIFPINSKKMNEICKIDKAHLGVCVPVYCSTSVTNLQKLEKVQLSVARIITVLKNTCPRHIVLFEADLQPLSLRRRAWLTKYYNKFRSLDSRNRTSAYFKDWYNNQRLRRNSPFSQMVSFNLTIGAVEPHHLSQCLNPVEDLDGVFFHPELPNPDGCSVFRSELIVIDEALGSLASLPNGKEIWILSDSRWAIHHLSNWKSVRDNVGVSILAKLKRLSTSHHIHLLWIPSHIDLEGNEIADILAKAGACEVPEPSAPLTFLEIFSRTKHQNKTAWITTPQSTVGINVLVLEALWLTVYQDRIKLF